MLDTAFVDVATGQRLLWSLVHDEWRRQTPLRGNGGGPMPGGPVRLGERVYMPVNDATEVPWQFSVHVLERGHWRQVGGPLNRGAGHAQGVLRRIGRSVWAVWQENAPRDDGLFDTRMFVPKVAPAGGPAREIWAGTSIGPGSTEVARGAGRDWVLYMPGVSGRRALTVAVKPLR